MKTLMILGARLAQRPAYETARRLGLRIVGADPDPSAPALPQADVPVVCDLGDAGFLLSVAREQRIDGAMTLGADYPMQALATIWDELGLTGPQPQAVQRATHKGDMRRAFRQAGVPSPAFDCVESAAQVQDLVARSAVDLIVKPAQSSGGRGVTRLEGGDTAAHARDAYRHAAAHTRDGRAVMVEHFVDGQEYSVEGIIWRGTYRTVAITEKLTTGPPRYVEIGHHQPPVLDERSAAAIAKVAGLAVQALGIDNAACHTELRMTPNGPVIMETAARAGGGFITSHLVPISTGVDMIEAVIRIALGDVPDLSPRRAGRPVAIRFLTATPGRIEGFGGVDEAVRSPGVLDVQLYKAPGDDIGELLDATARCGHVIAAGASVDEAIARARLARDLIRVTKSVC